MMALYEVEVNGKIIEVNADTPEQASIAGRLFLAGRGQVPEMERMAAERSAGPAQPPPGQDPQMAMALRAQEQAFNDPMGQGEGFLGSTGPATAAAVGAAAPMVMAPGAAALGLAGGYLGGELGGGIGGMFGLKDEGKAVGRLVGGIASPMKGLPALQKMASLGGGGGGMVGKLLQFAAGGEGAAAGTAAPGAQILIKEAAKDAAKQSAEKISKDIIQWRTVQKFSTQQMLDSLRNVHGIPPKEGRQVIEMVLRGAKEAATP